MNDTLPPQKPLGGGRQAAATNTPREGETREIRAETPAGAASGKLGPYEIEVKLGEGGMGKVYRCFDPTLKRRVAIKVLHEKFVEDARYKARFLREAQTVASLSHPAIAQVYGIDTSHGGLSIVMEHVDGESLEDRLLHGRPVPIGEAVALVRQAAEGLQTAFERGIIHRDIKPSNILVDRSGHVKLVDFGLAKDLGAEKAITDDGIVLGTPQYISPEQGRGHRVDQRSDIYSLGATFYHVVTGRMPFEQKSQIAVIVAHVQESPPAPHELRKELPDSVSRVIGAMMAARPEDRYRTYRELIEDLDSLAARRPAVHSRRAGGRFSTALAPRRKRGRRVALALALGALLVSGTLAVAVPLFSDADHTKALRTLGPWYASPRGGGDVLDLDFSRPPSGVEEMLDDVLIAPREARLPALSGDTLVWKDLTVPFACPYVFERLDEVTIHVHEQEGRFDLALALVHPTGSARRALIVPLRPAEEQPRPLVALRNGMEVTAEPEPPPLPRLEVPPYEVSLVFTPGEERTEIHLQITKPGRYRPLYDQRYRLPGRDWSSGAVVLKAASPRPFKVSLSKILFSGKLSGSMLTEVPWQS